MRYQTSWLICLLGWCHGFSGDGTAHVQANRKYSVPPYLCLVDGEKTEGIRDMLWDNPPLNCS